MCSAGSFTSSRTRSAAATPPGSRNARTSMPLSRSVAVSPLCSVVFPAPSMPSIVISRPLLAMVRSDPIWHYDRTVLPELDRHPHARAVLAPVFGGADASHAYLFHGPGGAGKRAVARAIAAE